MEHLPAPVLSSMGNSSYLEVLRISLRVAGVYLWTPSSHYRLPSMEDILRMNPGFWFDVASCLAGAATLIAFRMILNYVFINWINPKLNLVQPSKAAFFLESLYAFLASSVAFATALTIVHQYDYLPLQTTYWYSHSPLSVPPTSVWFLYIFSLSHYLHCLVAVFTLNPWIGADSLVLLVHHTFTLLLLGFSHLFKFHYFGVVTLYHHDICDVILEAGKLTLKLHLSSRWAVRAVELYKVVSFALLLFFWFYFRLGVFPLKIIYEGLLFYTLNGVEEIPVVFALIAMLWIVFLLSSYWAFLLLKVLKRTVAKGIGNIKEPREVEEKPKLKLN